MSKLVFFVKSNKGFAILLSLVMSMMVSFVLSFFPRDVLDEILNLIESVSEDFPSYSCYLRKLFYKFSIVTT